MEDLTVSTTESLFSGSYPSITEDHVTGADEEPQNRSQGYRTAIAIIYIIIFLAGSFGNGIILYTLLKAVRNLTVTETYVLCLAISDALFIINLPAAATDMLNGGNWIFGDFICKVFISLNYLTQCAGVLIVMAMSIDRFQNVVFAIRMMGRRTKKRAQIIIAVVWGLSLAYMIPASTWAETRPINESNRLICSMGYENNSFLSASQVAVAHTMFRFIVTFVVPFVVMVLCNSTIVYFLRRRRAKKISSRSGNAAGRRRALEHVKSQDRVTRLVLIVTTVFLFCCFPTLVCNAIWVTSPKMLNLHGMEFGETYKKILWFSVSLMYLNSALNPVLYAFSGSGFRQRIRVALFSKRPAENCGNKRAIAPKSPSTRATHVNHHQDIVIQELKPGTTGDVHALTIHEPKEYQNHLQKSKNPVLDQEDTSLLGDQRQQNTKSRLEHK